MVSNSCIDGNSAVHTEQRWQIAKKPNQNQKRGKGRGEGEGGRGGGKGRGEGFGLHAAPVSCIMPTRIVSIPRRLDCISRSVCLLVMPHSATSSARGDEISSTLSWNSGV